MSTQPLAFHKFPVQVPWQCDRRGDCCKKFDVVTMTTQERTLILDTVSLEVGATLKWRDDQTPGFVQLQAKPCPLLGADGGCTIYSIRPFNCRRFMCLRVGDEEWQTNPDGSCHNFTARLAQSRAARRFYELMQRKTSRWALKHGWNWKA